MFSPSAAAGVVPPVRAFVEQGTKGRGSLLAVDNPRFLASLVTVSPLYGGAGFPRQNAANWIVVCKGIGKLTNLSDRPHESSLKFRYSEFALVG